MKKYVLLAALCLASCASKQDIGPNGYSVSYSEGYSDGCASGTRRGIINDDDRFDGEEQYALGWSDGFRTCESAEGLAERQGRVNILNNGVAAAQSEYFESYQMNSKPSKKVSMRLF